MLCCLCVLYVSRISQFVLDCCYEYTYFLLSACELMSLPVQSIALDVKLCLLTFYMTACDCMSTVYHSAKMAYILQWIGNKCAADDLNWLKHYIGPERDHVYWCHKWKLKVYQQFVLWICFGLLVVEVHHSCTIYKSIWFASLRSSEIFMCVFCM